MHGGAGRTLQEVESTPKNNKNSKRVGFPAKRNNKPSSRRMKSRSKGSRPSRGLAASFGRMSATTALNTVPMVRNTVRAVTLSVPFSEIQQVELSTEAEVCGMINITPIMSRRLLSFNALYDNVRLKSLAVSMMPLYGTSVAGSFCHVFDYNASDGTTPIHYASLMSMNGSVSTPLYIGSTLQWRPQDLGDKEYGETSCNSTFRADNKAYLYRWAYSLPNTEGGAVRYFNLRFDICVEYRNLLPVTQGSTVNAVFGLTSESTALPVSVESPISNVASVPLPSATMTSTQVLSKLDSLLRPHMNALGHDLQQ